MIEAARRALLDAGVPDRVIMTPLGLCGAFTQAPIETFEDGTFQPIDAGLPAIMFPVLDDVDEVADIVAFYLASPGRWWRHTCWASILGMRQLHDAAQHERPLFLWETPLSWLRAGCDGAVILDWRTCTLPLTVIDRIVTETEALALRLRAAFARPGPKIRTARRRG